METKTITIQEQINLDLKQAMLQKNEAVKSLLRVVIGEFNRVDKTVSDEKAIAILKKMVENAKEIGNSNEINILEQYLPSQLTSNQLKMLISQIVEDENFTSIKDMGKIMNIIKDEYSGRYDGKVASTLVKEYFS